MATDVDREPKFRAKIAHLDSLHADIQEKQKFTPKLFWLSVLAIPVAIFKGIGWGVVLILFVFALVATVAYLLGVRGRDYAAERQQLARLYPERPAAPEAVARDASETPPESTVADPTEPPADPGGT